MLVSDPHKEESSFGAVDGDLPGDLIEALAEEFFPDGTDALIPGLSVFKCLVE